MTRRSATIGGVFTAALIIAQVALRQDERLWVARGSLPETASVDGHLVEYEAYHVGETVNLVAGLHAPTQISSQNAYRFVPGFAIALFRPLAGSTYAGGLVATAVGWAIAAASLAALASVALRSHAAAGAAAGLTALGAGFVAFTGNIDAHQFGYVGVAGALGLHEVLRARARRERPGSAAPAHALLAGAGLCAAAYTMEVALPLIAFLWLFHGVSGLTSRSAGWHIRWLGLVTLGFAAPYLGFRLALEQLLGMSVVDFNAPGQRLALAANDALRSGLPNWALERTGNVLLKLPATYTPPVLVLALVGIFCLPRFWAAWSLALFAVMTGAIGIVKPLVRDLYLAYPAVYLPAAAACAWLSGRLGRRVGARLGARPGRWAAALALGLLLGLVAAATNADLLGDYTLPLWWWHVL